MKTVGLVCVAAFAMSASALLTLSHALQQDQNSTRKIRVQPSEYAAQVGSAINWRDSLDQARIEAAQSGKPIFWYVPTIQGTFMDRKPVIDRYMLAGPFSWPPIIQLINENFIPLNAQATGRVQHEYGLEPYRFVEPGFVLLSPQGDKIVAIDQLTTLNPTWFEKLVRQALEIPEPEQVVRGGLDVAWNEFRSGNYSFDEQSIQAPEADAAEKILLQGCFLFRRGQHDQAQKVWQTAQTIQPSHPLAWKAAAEAEGWGPFVRGFEVHRSLPEAAYRAGLESRGSAAPHPLYSEQELWERSVDYLLAMQRDNGGWFDSDYDYGGTDSLPNVYVAVTSLCGSALIEALDRLPNHRDKLIDAINRAGEYVIEPNHINYFDRDEILWAHAYRIRFLTRLIDTLHPDHERFRAGLNRAVEDIHSVQTLTGSWYHEYANPFVTATALTALKAAESIGATSKQEHVRKGLEALAKDRYDNGAFPYSGRGKGHPESQQSGDGKIPQSAGRMPLCELALYQWGGSSDERLQFALESAFEFHEHLQAGYKYDNHTSTMAYGGFFFWYDMHGRSEAISYIRNDSLRSQLITQQREQILRLPELDGCFVDSHELGRCYGTALALKCLAFLDRATGGPSQSSD